MTKRTSQTAPTKCQYMAQSRSGVRCAGPSAAARGAQGQPGERQPGRPARGRRAGRSARRRPTGRGRRRGAAPGATASSRPRPAAPGTRPPARWPGPAQAATDRGSPSPPGPPGPLERQAGGHGHQGVEARQQEQRQARQVGRGPGRWRGSAPARRRRRGWRRAWPTRPGRPPCRRRRWPPAAARVQGARRGTPRSLPDPRSRPSCLPPGGRIGTRPRPARGSHGRWPRGRAGRRGGAVRAAPPGCGRSCGTRAASRRRSTPGWGCPRGCARWWRR